MGKAKGPKRKEAPARKRLQASNSGLLHKHNHKPQHKQAGLDGGASMGKRTLAQQLLLPNKSSRGGKRRRKADGPLAKPGSSETAAIQAEYSAVDAREKAKLDSEEARRVRAPVRVRLAPATATAGLRMPSQGDVSMAELRASSSARMVEALLQSITDDPAPNAPPSRPVRSAGRKRRGNPYAALGGDSDSDNDSNEYCSGGMRLAGGGSSELLAFVSPTALSGASGGGGGGGGSAAGSAAWGLGGGVGVWETAQPANKDDQDPDL